MIYDTEVHDHFIKGKLLFTHKYGRSQETNSFCKNAIGISKYSSNILTVGEFERYPIIIRSVVLGILYWWRLERELITHY